MQKSKKNRIIVLTYTIFIFILIALIIVNYDKLKLVLSDPETIKQFIAGFWVRGRKY